jgi:hypothetical protein
MELSNWRAKGGQSRCASVGMIFGRVQGAGCRGQAADGNFFCKPSSVFCLPFSGFRCLDSSGGSVLVMVLWVLILVSFLAGQYVSHNREKADVARNAWDTFRQRTAVASMIQLFSTDSWPIPDGTGADGRWFRLFPDGADVWVRVDKETQRVNLNSGSEADIKQKIGKSMDDSRQRESDEISDAILDWRDEDDLARMRGAEEKDYAARGVSYRPANGPFNAMTELLMVKGVTPEIFWGDPVRAIEMNMNQRSGRYVRTEENTELKSLSELATIYATNTKRISLLVPGEANVYLYMNIFVSRETGRLQVAGSQETLRVAETGFDRLIELESEFQGVEAKEIQRR